MAGGGKGKGGRRKWWDVSYSARFKQRSRCRLRVESRRFQRELLVVFDVGVFGAGARVARGEHSEKEQVCGSSLLELLVP